MIRKKKSKAILYNLRRGPGDYLLAEMTEEDFDKLTTGKDAGLVLEINGKEIYFLRTPIIPIVIFRGIKQKENKLPFE